MPKYNEIATALLEPFDESEISEREGAGGKNFSYVPPERYRYRMLQVFKQGYKLVVEPGSLIIGKEGVAALYHFIGEDPETMTRYEFSLPAFEPWSTKTDGTIITRDQTMNKLTSAGLKAVCREMGLGLHLYDKPARTVGSATKRTTGTSQGNVGASTGTWTGDTVITFGKNKGIPYNEIDDGWIGWACDKMNDDGPNPDKNAMKERARRQGSAASDGEKSASASAGDDDEFPF